VGTDRERKSENLKEGASLEDIELDMQELECGVDWIHVSVSLVSLCETACQYPLNIEVEIVAHTFLSNLSRS
jgi:hypothetical protein